MSEFVDGLKFKNVKLDTLNSTKTRLFIDFILLGEYDFFYRFVNEISLGEGIHHHFSDYKTCPFCQEKTQPYSTDICPIVTSHIKDIENFLLNHPNVRLRRLFL